MVGALDRIVSRMWAFHFRLHRFFWCFAALVLVAAVIAAPSAELRIAAVVLALVCGAGGVRWHRARRRCRGALLLVPRFFEGGGAAGHAEEAQRIVLDTLREHLPVDQHDVVQPVEVVIGSDEQEFAEKTRKRLGGLFVLHGRVAARPGGGWSVFPRLLEPAYSSTTHIDWFTRDRTPASPRFGPFVSSLTPQVGVSDEEFPFEFCRDLEALLRGVNGRLALAMHEPERALELLDRALAVAGESTNAQIDALRSARARALSELDQVELGIESLRERAAGPDPSPALLRELAHLLLRWVNADAELGRQPPLEARAEMLQTLRLARADETDPQREQSTYNLFAILDFAAADERERAEGSVLLDELLRSRSGYQRQWYVRRAAGVRAWRALEHAHAAGDEAAAKREGAEAGRWYSRAIRARPRIQVDALGFHWPPLRFHRVPPSPILYANAYDGHHWGGHRLRARWCEWRFQLIRKSFMKRGWKLMEAQEWNRAYPYYDWVAIVGRTDLTEAWAETYAAICLWKQGFREQAELVWAQAMNRPGPFSLLARANAVFFFERWGFDSSVPGPEPTAQDEVEALIRERYGVGSP